MTILYVNGTDALGISLGLPSNANATFHTTRPTASHRLTSVPPTNFTALVLWQQEPSPSVTPEPQP